MLAEPRGTVDPTASVRRGVFSAGDTWISTEYVFHRDHDGDYWLMGTRGSVIRTARGPIYDAPITDAIGMMPVVDLAVTYGVQAGEREVAVTAVTMCSGAVISAADLSEAMAGLGTNRPDFVHVVSELTLSASYRPTVGGLRNAGIPKAGRHSWYLDPETSRYRRLTVPARAEWVQASP